MADSTSSRLRTKIPCLLKCNGRYVLLPFALPRPSGINDIGKPLAGLAPCVMLHFSQPGCFLLRRATLSISWNRLVSFISRSRLP
jgi:hypothetical protein